MDGKCNGVSEGEEGYIFHSPLNANGINSRKRVKLQGKLSDDRCPMNSPFVPKRLRSDCLTYDALQHLATLRANSAAKFIPFNKRVNQSVSSPSSDSRRKRQHASNGTQLCNSFSAERVKQNMLNSVTKDEEEVAETLTSMANLITVTKPVGTKEDGKMLEENLEMKATSSYLLEAPKEEDTKFLVPCNGTTLGNPSPCVEEKQTVMSVPKKFDAEDNGSSLPNSLKKLSSDEEPVEGVAPLRDAMKVSYPLGTSLQYFPINGMLRPTQLDSHLVQRQELGPTAMKHDLQSFEQKPDYVAHDVRGKAPDGQPGLHSRIHEQLTNLLRPSSSKAATNPNSVTVSGRPCSTNSLPIEKLSLTSADKKRPWKKCITHVYITCLIQNHQKTLKRQLIMLQCNQSVPSEGTNHAVPVSSGSVLDRSMLEARNWKLQDERLLQAPKGCDLVSLLAVGDTKSLNGMESVGKLHAPCPPNQAAMPLTVPPGCYTFQYHEKLAAGTTQQVQMKLPMYIASDQLYGQHIGQNTTGETTTKQQQLMWQAQFAHYMQNERQHNSSSSPLNAQPSSIFPLHGDYSNPHNLYQPFVLSVHSSSSSLLSSRSKQKQIVAESFR